MQIAGIGRVVFWEGGSLWLALITGGNSLHLHHAIQVSLPLDGTILLRLVDLGIRQGDIDPSSMMSAQEHLSAIAYKIERDGVHENDIPDLVIKLRQISEYATTRLVPMEPY